MEIKTVLWQQFSSGTHLAKKAFVTVSAMTQLQNLAKQLLDS